MTTPPRAITMPHDRSMPAVRMIRVWPMANTPTTITCCSTSDRFSPLKKRADWVAKNRQVTANAIQGPSAPQGMGRLFVVDITDSGLKVESLRHRDGQRGGNWCPVVTNVDRASAGQTGVHPAASQQAAYLLPQHRSKPTLVSLLSTPVTALLAISVTPVST